LIRLLRIKTVLVLSVACAFVCAAAVGAAAKYQGGLLGHSSLRPTSEAVSVDEVRRATRLGSGGLLSIDVDPTRRRVRIGQWLFSSNSRPTLADARAILGKPRECLPFLPRGGRVDAYWGDTEVLKIEFGSLDSQSTLGCRDADGKKMPMLRVTCSNCVTRGGLRTGMFLRDLRKRFPRTPPCNNSDPFWKRSRFCYPVAASYFWLGRNIVPVGPAIEVEVANDDKSGPKLSILSMGIVFGPARAPGVPGTKPYP